MADAYYNRMVSLLNKVLTKKGTLGLQLQIMGKNLFGNKFKGVFASDEIPSLQSGYTIVNLSPSGESGEHWIAVVFKGNKKYVYDSFGRDIHKILPQLKGSVIQSKRDPEQKRYQKDCGQRALAWLATFDTLGASQALTI